MTDYWEKDKRIIGKLNMGFEYSVLFRRLDNLRRCCSENGCVLTFLIYSRKMINVLYNLVKLGVEW